MLREKHEDVFKKLVKNILISSWIFNINHKRFLFLCDKIYVKQKKKKFSFFGGIPVKFNLHAHSKLMYHVRILDPDLSIFAFQEEQFLLHKLPYVNCSKTEVKSGGIIYLRNNIMYVLLSNGRPRPCSLQEQW